MADTFNFDDAYESEADTLDGAPSRDDLDPESAVKQQLYTSHQIATRPDGSPIVQGESAQQRLEREQRAVKARDAFMARRAAQGLAPAPQYETQEQDAAMDEAVAGLSEERRAIEATLTEAERRFDKAKYYKLILSQQLISDSSPAGQEVEAEIRTFAQERFEVFLGMRQEKRDDGGALPPAMRDWDAEDFQTLHALVRRIRQKPELAGPPAPRPEPSIKPVSVTPSPGTSVEPTIRPIAAQPGAAPAPRPAAVRRHAPSTARATPGKRIIRAAVGEDGQAIFNSRGKPLMQDVTPQVTPSPESPHQPVPMPMDKGTIEMMHFTQAQQGAAMVGQATASFIRAAGTTQPALAKAGAAGIRFRPR